jgi:hypothetical protein
MNVEIGADAVLFPEKEYINGIAVAVRAAQLRATLTANCWNIADETQPYTMTPILHAGCVI